MLSRTSRIGAPYIYDISSLRVNTSANCCGRKQVKGYVQKNVTEPNFKPLTFCSANFCKKRL